MLLAAIVELQSNLAQRFFAVHDQLFGPFYFLKNEIALNGFTFNSRKKPAQLLIILGNVLGQIIR